MAVTAKHVCVMLAVKGKDDECCSVRSSVRERGEGVKAKERELAAASTPSYARIIIIIIIYIYYYCACCADLWNRLVGRRVAVGIVTPIRLRTYNMFINYT